MLFVQWRILLPVFFGSQVVFAIFAGRKEDIMFPLHERYSSRIPVCIPNTILNFNNTGLRRIGDIFVNTSDIKELYLDDNEITHISDKAFDLIEGLEILSISGNQLDLNVLSWLRHHETLRSLLINNNRRSNYDVSIANTFAYLPNLEILSLRGDSISQFDVLLDKFTPKLRVLDLSENYIQSFHFLDNIPETMEALMLEKNGCPCKIRKLPANIRYLFLSGNKITELCGTHCSHSHSLSLKGMEWLNILNVSSNSINSIVYDAFQDTIHMQTLDLSNNYIGSVPDDGFERLSNLKELHMSHNLLQVVPKISSLFNIRYLDLSNNYIRETTNLDCLKSIDTLEWLDLSNNRIKILPMMLISHTKSIGWNLLLKNNSITNIDDLFTDKCLEVQFILHLQNNPFSFFKFNALTVHTGEPVLHNEESNTVPDGSLEEFPVDFNDE